MAYILLFKLFLTNELKILELLVCFCQSIAVSGLFNNFTANFIQYIEFLLFLGRLMLNLMRAIWRNFTRNVKPVLIPPLDIVDIGSEKSSRFVVTYGSQVVSCVPHRFFHARRIGWLRRSRKSFSGRHLETWPQSGRCFCINKTRFNWRQQRWIDWSLPTPSVGLNYRFLHSHTFPNNSTLCRPVCMLLSHATV